MYAIRFNIFSDVVCNIAYIMCTYSLCICIFYYICYAMPIYTYNVYVSAFAYRLVRLSGLKPLCRSSKRLLLHYVLVVSDKRIHVFLIRSMYTQQTFTPIMYFNTNTNISTYACIQALRPLIVLWSYILNSYVLTLIHILYKPSNHTLTYIIHTHISCTIQLHLQYIVSNHIHRTLVIWNLYIYIPH